MKRLPLLALAVVLVPLGANAAEPPSWAFEQSPPGLKETADPATRRTLPGSTLTFTQKQIDDFFHAVDWFPKQHPPMPKIVEFGAKPSAYACAVCHLTSGAGHPEGASLAGLPPNYFAEQMAAFKSGSRKYGRAMATIAPHVSPAGVRAAALYFAHLPAIARINVVESPDAPKTFVGTRNLRRRDPSDATEPIGERIVEVPARLERTTARDPHDVFTAYVPPGSIARGKALVTSGVGGTTIACTACHGALLTGRGDVPPIAGRSPTSTFRQLYLFGHRLRSGGSAPQMYAVVQRLKTADMIAIAAYLGTLSP